MPNKEVNQSKYLIGFDLKKLPTEFTDVLVIGSGVAGLTAALTAAEKLKVQILAKTTIEQTCTWFAQGGIAAPLAANDSPELHYRDTIAAGAGLCDPHAVKVLVDEASEAVDLLMKYGTAFDRQGGKLQLGLEGGHSVSRVVHTGDSTGSAVVDTLVKAARQHKNIDLAEDVFVIDLIVDANQCCGALVYDVHTKKLMTYSAKAIVLASGGVGQVYEITTNPPAATGDGLAMAFRQRAKMAGLEFVQFHPTALAIKKSPQFLISEAVRGEGAYLVNKKEERFMKTIHPLNELAPRDIVCQEVVRAMRLDGADHVYLDARHIGGHKLKTRFPVIWERCRVEGFDMSKDLIPVAPSAHYFVGGIKTDLYGRTSIKNLYASGEVASTGVHGANRLASNSLLEGVVFSRRIGVLLCGEIKTKRQLSLPEIKVKKRLKGSSLDDVRHRLRRLMSEKVGPVRTNEGLAEALGQLDEWLKLLDYEYDNPNDWETINMIMLAALIASRASVRRDSVGVHHIARG